MSTTSKTAMARRLRELGVTASVNTLRQYTREQLVGMVEQAERLAAITPEREPAPEPTPEAAELVDTEAQHILAHIDAEPQPVPKAVPYATVAPPIPHLPLVPKGYGAINVPGSFSAPRAEADTDTLARVVGLLLMPMTVLRLIAGF